LATFLSDSQHDGVFFVFVLFDHCVEILLAVQLARIAFTVGEKQSHGFSFGGFKPVKRQLEERVVVNCRDELLVASVEDLKFVFLLRVLHEL